VILLLSRLYPSQLQVSLMSNRPLELLALSKVDSADRRMNLGRGRQIIPEQMLHRSVGLRMIYDTEKANHDRSLRDQGYFAPHASVAAGWPSWKDIAQGKASDSDVWEE